LSFFTNMILSNRGHHTVTFSAKLGGITFEQ
jgi:hypothetical protein